MSITAGGKALLQQVKHTDTHTPPRRMQTPPAHNTFTRHTTHAPPTGLLGLQHTPASSPLRSARPDLLPTEQHWPAQSVLTPKPSPQQHSILSLCLNDKAYQAKRTFSDKNPLRGSRRSCRERSREQPQLGGETASRVELQVQSPDC